MKTRLSNIREITQGLRRTSLGVCFACLACLASSHTVSAQGFVNLNFEQATVAPTPAGQFGSLFADPVQAFPGWTMGPNGTQNSNYTLYNNLTLGSVAQVLVGPNLPNAVQLAPLQGSYSALLQFGPSDELGTPALIQTGAVPADARSITFLASATMNDARVLLNRVNIPLVAMGGGRLAGDVSPFAGQTAELIFSTVSYSGSWLYFDDVQFSPMSVPEPSTLVLTMLATGAFLAARRPRNR